MEPVDAIQILNLIAAAALFVVNLVFVVVVVRNAARVVNKTQR